MIRKLKEFLAEQAELRKKNRLLEVWITKHMKKVKYFNNFNIFISHNWIYKDDKFYIYTQYIYISRFLFCIAISYTFYFFFFSDLVLQLK